MHYALIPESVSGFAHIVWNKSGNHLFVPCPFLTSW